MCSTRQLPDSAEMILRYPPRTVVEWPSGDALSWALLSDGAVVDHQAERQLRAFGAQLRHLVVAGAPRLDLRKNLFKTVEGAPDVDHASMAAHPGWAFRQADDQVGPCLQNALADGCAFLADGLPVSPLAFDRGMQHRRPVAPLIEGGEGVL